MKLINLYEGKQMKKFLLGTVLVLTVSLLSGCFPKAYTSKGEKEQLAHAIAIARVYQKNTHHPSYLKRTNFTYMMPCVKVSPSFV